MIRSRISGVEYLEVTLCGMTVTEPQFDPLQDDYDFVATPEQQAMVEQRLAEMLADPNLGMTYEEMDQFLDNLEI